MTQWGVYILRCGDGTLYTGITDDLPRRLRSHRSGHGAKYTRGRAPLTPVYWEPCTDLSAAAKREYAIKRLSRAEKEALLPQSAPIPDDIKTTTAPLAAKEF